MGKNLHKTRSYNFSRGRRFLQLFILLIPIFLLFYLGYIHRWITDDAIISFRVVKNFLLGYGPLYNIDERVEIYTHPLWIFILSIFSFVTGSIEQTSVWLGLIFSSFGLFFGELGNMRLNQKEKNSSKSKRATLLYLPFGALVISVLSPYWDFSTSGLETGLSFFWLGSSFYLLSSHSKRTIIPIWISLGPLIRPDFGIIYLGFLFLLIYKGRKDGFGSCLKNILLSLFLPILYQIFRMGYFASFFPNPAFAKEAFRLNIKQGVLYLFDFLIPYGLYIPILLSLINLFNLKKNPLGLYFFIIGLSHILYIVLMGGDFMHGRFLLPGFFLLFVSSGIIPINKSKLSLFIISVSIVWSIIICGFRLKLPYEGGKNGIINERKYYVAGSISKNPIKVSDYQYTMFYQAGLNANKESMALEEGDILFLYNANLGITGFVAGYKVHYFDWVGLSDPIGARFFIEKRGRPGHEKKLPIEWVIARVQYNLENKDIFTKKPSYILILNDTKYNLKWSRIEDQNIKYAKEALYGIKDYLDGIQERLTAERFFRNIPIAWKYRNLRIPSDPYEAKLKFSKNSDKEQQK